MTRRTILPLLALVATFSTKNAAAQVVSAIAFPSSGNGLPASGNCNDNYTSNPCFEVGNGGSGNAPGIQGNSSGLGAGIYGTTSSLGPAVEGNAQGANGTGFGTGVEGLSTYGNGVYGQTATSTESGTVGWNTATSGAAIGVFGYSANTSSGFAIYADGNFRVTGTPSCNGCTVFTSYRGFGHAHTTTRRDLRMEGSGRTWGPYGHAEGVHCPGGRERGSGVGRGGWQGDEDSQFVGHRAIVGREHQDSQVSE